MNVEQLIQAAVREALAVEFPRVADDYLAQPRLVSVKSKPRGLSPRLVADAAKRGELKVYKRGNSSFVDLHELDAWILRAPVNFDEQGDEPDDEIGELIAMGDRRRKVAR